MESTLCRCRGGLVLGCRRTSSAYRPWSILSVVLFARRGLWRHRWGYSSGQMVLSAMPLPRCREALRKYIVYGLIQKCLTTFLPICRPCNNCESKQETIPNFEHVLQDLASLIGRLQHALTCQSPSATCFNETACQSLATCVDHELKLTRD